MEKKLIKLILIILFASIACTPQVDVTPASEPKVAVTKLVPSPTSAEGLPAEKNYSNSEFRLAFQYPASWFGPDEYISGQTLRVEVGSDIVYPYGEPPEQSSIVNNSYRIVIQYTKGNQNPYWEDTYQSLANLQDGESLSGTRSLIIKVRQFELGNLIGFEYISTLSETAQTEPVYSREVILVDDMSNLLTISGSPSNVAVTSTAKWQDVYRMIDEENQDIFHDILSSITIE